MVNDFDINPDEAGELTVENLSDFTFAAGAPDFPEPGSLVFDTDGKFQGIAGGTGGADMVVYPYGFSGPLPEGAIWGSNPDDPFNFDTPGPWAPGYVPSPPPAERINPDTLGDPMAGTSIYGLLFGLAVSIAIALSIQRGDRLFDPYGFS
jgi:hypothetical protein|tara:strand:- start:1317 stop:1766 length:450 start_codon:yes stop_codon:yes gene_type:complete